METFVIHIYSTYYIVCGGKFTYEVSLGVIY